MELSDLGRECDKEEDVAAKRMQFMNGTISRFTTALATICGVRDRRHNERRYVKKAIATAHTMNACINGEEQCSEADDQEFAGVQKGN